MNIGAQAELAAARYLQQHGLRLIAQNYRCRFGEIDLILHDGETLVFAEVRLRTRTDFGGAAASIDARKQAKLIRTAQFYLATLAHIPPCRFDAVLLRSPATHASLPNSDIEWIKNAFDA